MAVTFLVLLISTILRLEYLLFSTIDLSSNVLTKVPSGQKFFCKRIIVQNHFTNRKILPEYTLRSVKQGCPLSPLWLAIFLNDMDDELTEGVTIEGKNKLLRRQFKWRIRQQPNDILILADHPANLRHDKGIKKVLRYLESYCKSNEVESFGL